MIENKLELISIARPYAIAAFEFSRERKEVEHWQEMLELSTLVSSNKIMNNISGSLSYRMLYKLFITICEPYIDRYFKNFMEIMAENKRLKLLPKILEIFKYLRRVYYDLTEEIEVITANRISNEQFLKLQRFCENLLLRQIKIHLKMDKNILFGIIIRIGDMVIDGSGRSRINRLAEILLQS
ncbi:MAG: F0F1 ATP synthase subunit delta [Candidatus Dasytiphilus stammeri]